MTHTSGKRGGGATVNSNWLLTSENSTYKTLSVYQRYTMVCAVWFAIACAVFGRPVEKSLFAGAHIFLRECSVMLLLGSKVN